MLLPMTGKKEAATATSKVDIGLGTVLSRDWGIGV
jgi:hypothetical protein